MTKIFWGKFLLLKYTLFKRDVLYISYVAGVMAGAGDGCIN